MVKITACVITKDEENNIYRWLQCMKKITKDIVLIDTGSNDRTVEIARQNGAKVYFYQWHEDFSAAKNFAIDKASGEWIIFLDADEYFSDESIRNVRKNIEIYHGKKNVDGLICKIINIDQDDYNFPICESSNLRIFRNLSNIRFTRPIHEQLIKVNEELKVCIINSGVEIYHTGYSKKVLEKKLKRNLDILLDEINLQGEKPYHYRYLCECYYGLKDYANAEKYARLHMQLGEKCLGYDNNIQKRIIECMIFLGKDSNEILDQINSFSIIYPDDIEFLWYKGTFYYSEKMFSRAEKFYLEFLKMYSNKNDLDYFGYNTLETRALKAYFFLAIIFEYKGDMECAMYYYDLLLTKQKYNQEALYNLINLLSDKNQVSKYLNQIYNQTEMDVNFVQSVLKSFPEFEETQECNNFLNNEQLVVKLQENYQNIIYLALTQAQEEDNTIKSILPIEYWQVYKKLSGDEIILTPEGEIVFSQISQRLKYKNVEKAQIYLKDKGIEFNDCIAIINMTRNMENEENTESCLGLLSYYESGQLDFQDVTEIIRLLIAKPTKTFLLLAMYFYQNGHVNKAIRLLLAVVKKEPGNEDVIYALALFFKASNDTKSAIKVLNSYKGTRKDLIELKEILNK